MARKIASLTVLTALVLSLANPAFAQSQGAPEQPPQPTEADKKPRSIRDYVEQEAGRLVDEKVVPRLPRRVHNALTGAAVGAGVGVGAGFIAAKQADARDPYYFLLSVGIGSGVGALIGALIR